MAPAIWCGGVSRVAKGADCKSAGLRLRRFESYLPHHPHRRRGPSVALRKASSTSNPVKHSRKPAFRPGARFQRRLSRAEPRHRADAAAGGVLLGWDPVTAALAHPARRVRKLWATENAVRRLNDEGIALLPEPELVRPDALAARLSPEA